MFINRKDFGCGCNLVGTNKFCGDYIYEEYGASQCLCEVCHAERTECERIMREQEKEVEEAELEEAIMSEAWKVLVLFVGLIGLVAWFYYKLN